jgi:hypothetical protein
MAKIERFEEIESWKKARELAKSISFTSRSISNMWRPKSLAI